MRRKTKEPAAGESFPLLLQVFARYVVLLQKIRRAAAAAAPNVPAVVGCDVFVGSANETLVGDETVDDATEQVEPTLSRRKRMGASPLRIRKSSPRRLLIGVDVVVDVEHCCFPLEDEVLLLWCAIKSGS